MNLTELRIGNHVLAGDKIEKITGVIQYGLYFNFGYFPNLNDWIKPVELTEEWLAKTNAKLFPWGWVIGEVLIRTNLKNKFWIELGNGARIKLPYVHTLQNFIALTGEELTLNEK